MREHQLTVAELVEKLKQFPEHALVWHEGCDCYGKADDIREIGETKDGIPEVLITRSN